MARCRRNSVILPKRPTYIRSLLVYLYHVSIECRYSDDDACPSNALTFGAEVCFYNYIM